MNRNKWLLTGISILLIAVLYIFGETRPPKKNIEEGVAENVVTNNAMVSIAGLHEGLKTPITVADIQNPDSILRFCDTSINLYCALFLDTLSSLDSTFLEQSGKLWFKLYLNQSKKDSLNFLLNRAQLKYSQLVNINPSHNHKVSLANCYLQNQEQTMQGITLLLEVTKEDSLHAGANLLLGKYGIISGQFNKAIDRLEKVVSSQPNNAEALFLLAEAYNGAGDKETAVYYFQQCIQFVENEEFKKEVEAIIQSLLAS